MLGAPRQSGDARVADDFMPNRRPYAALMPVADRLTPIGVASFGVMDGIVTNPAGGVLALPRKERIAVQATFDRALIHPLPH